LSYFQEPGQETRVQYTSTGEEKYDEGIVQTSKVKTRNFDADRKYLYVSMWAVNKVSIIIKARKNYIYMYIPVIPPTFDFVFSFDYYYVNTLLSSLFDMVAAKE
jgi:hypothetical protein